MEFFWYAALGGFFGFAFGVGCALAVMYSIYMGGYRAAIKDSKLIPPPARFTKALEAHEKLDSFADAHKLHY